MSATWVLRMQPADAVEREADIDRLDEMLQGRGMGEVEGTIDIGGAEFIVMIELRAESELPFLEEILDTLGLLEVASLEEPQDDDGDEGLGLG